MVGWALTPEVVPGPPRSWRNQETPGGLSPDGPGIADTLGPLRLVPLFCFLPEMPAQDSATGRGGQTRHTLQLHRNQARRQDTCFKY